METSQAKKDLRRVVGDVFVSWDFFVAVVVATAGFIAASHSQAVRNEGVTILLGAAAVGVALLAVALTALAILVGLMSQEYVQLLEKAEQGDVSKAFLPYRIVAVVSTLATLSSLLVALFWHVTNPLGISARSGQAFGLSVALGFATWSLGGTMQLVTITARHGAYRAQWLRLLLDTKRKLQRASADKSPTDTKDQSA